MSIIFANKIFRANHRMRFLLLLISLFFLHGCSGTCETAEEVMTDEKIITIYTNPKDGNSNISGVVRPQDTWVATEHSVEQNQAKDPKFNVLVNTADLCGKNTNTIISNNSVQLNLFGQYFDTSINVKQGDFLIFKLNKKEIPINCSSPDPRISIIDVDKCKNGYYKDGSTTFISAMDGKKVELESFISLNNPNDFIDIDTFRSKVHNVFIPSTMLLDIKNANQNANFEFNNSLIPGKASIVPNEYEVVLEGDSGKKYYSYSQIPAITNSNDEKFMKYQFSSKADMEDPDRAKEENKKYWCRVFPDVYANLRSKNPSETNLISGVLNRNINIDSVMINQFCDKYYYLDKGSDDDVSNIMEYDIWKDKTLSDKFMGNTAIQENKIYSIMNNMSYKKIETEDSSGAVNTRYFFLTNSRFFYMLNANIGTPSSMSFDSTIGNVNSSYADCNSKSFLVRCDANNFVQLPLDQPIPVKQDGKVYLRVGVPTSASSSVNVLGFTDIKVIRSCPLKKLYGIFVENENELKSVKPGEGASFEIPLYENDNLGNPIPVEEFVVSKNLVTSGRKSWLYLSFKDNGDGYDNNNGIIKLTTRVPRDSSKNVMKFINKFINKMMDILYGERNDPNIDNSPRNGGIVNLIYTNIVSSKDFQAIINLCALLMVVIYGIAILMGLAQFNSGDLIRTFVKFGIIYMLLRPGSWDLFNKYFFNLFINGPKQLIQFVTTPPDGNLGTNSENYIFGPISDVIQRFTDFAIWKQLISIIFAGPLGWILFFFLLQSCWFFLTGSLSAILTYFVSIVIVGVFISIAPIFILCLMFKKTAGIFNAWIKVLMVNTLNAVFVFAALTLVSGIASILINQIFGFGVCTDCVLTYNGPLENFNFCILYGDMPDNFGGHLSYEDRMNSEASIATYPEAQNQFMGFPFPFFAFISFIIMSHIVSNLSVFFSLMTEDLIGVDYGSPTQAANIPSKVAETMQSWVGIDRESKQQEVYKRSKGGGKRDVAVKDKDESSKKKR